VSAPCAVHWPRPRWPLVLPKTGQVRARALAGSWSGEPTPREIRQRVLPTRHLGRAARAHGGGHACEWRAHGNGAHERMCCGLGAMKWPSRSNCVWIDGHCGAQQPCFIVALSELVSKVAILMCDHMSRDLQQRAIWQSLPQAVCAPFTGLRLHAGLHGFTNFKE
jgi:hypothetical protein